MRIIILDTLINQANDRRIPTDVIRRLNDEFRVLSHLERRGPCAVISYLKHNDDGIKMKGALGKGDIPIFKFRISGGDRILYTYGKYLPYIADEDDSVVLLEFSPHDTQAKIAKSRDYTVEHKYEYIHRVAESISILDEEDMSEDDLRETVSLILSENFKGYGYSGDDIQNFSIETIDAHVILSPEQKDIKSSIVASLGAKNDKTASFIVGGAGTGKTLICIRLLDDFNKSNQNKCAIYFTQSRELLKKVEKQYGGIALTGTSNDIEFFNINDFCLEQLGLDDSRLVLTHHFIEFLHSTDKFADKIRQLRAKIPNIDDIMIWTEIRGVLKGSMGTGTIWEHCAPLNQNDFPSCIRYLFDAAYLERVEVDGKKTYFRLRESVEDTKCRILNDDEISIVGTEELKDALQQILAHFSSFDPNMRMMSKDEYLGVSNEISVLNIEQRGVLYDIACLYDDYLLKNSLLDENDLIRELFANRDTAFPSYDFAMVDETQDYTEMQLYFVHQICTDPLNVVFAGDVHQIINPTVFDVSRLKSLYLDSQNRSALELYFLRSNFRCQQGVVDLANKISNLRREAVGRKNEEIERQESSSVPVIYSYPYRLSYTDDNLKNMIEELIRYPNIAILVSSNAEKRKIKDFIFSHQCITTQDEMPQIFTVAEIKGMEYAYIICFNMISSFDYLVSKIFKDSKVVKSRETRNRFCFNAMYVATTRAQHHLCFIDERTNEAFEKRLELPVVSVFEPSELYFDTLSDSLEAWRTKAIELKENGNYEEALRFLKRAGNSAQETDFYECKAELALQQRLYDRAVLYFLFLDDMKNVHKYVRERTVSKEAKDYVKFVVDGKVVKNITRLTRKLAEVIDSEDRELLFSKTLDNIESSLMQAYDSLVIPEV